jgi:hypothetical protein
MPAQRLELGDVVLIQLPGEEREVEAKVEREIERTPTSIRASLRLEDDQELVKEWALGELVTVVRGP